jgi:hypothetical protein
MSAEEMLRRIDECLDEWRAKDAVAKPYWRDEYMRRLHDLQVPPDIAARWLDSKRPVSTRRLTVVSRRQPFPQRAMHP